MDEEDLEERLGDRAEPIHPNLGSPFPLRLLPTPGRARFPAECALARLMTARACAFAFRPKSS